MHLLICAQHVSINNTNTSCPFPLIITTKCVPENVSTGLVARLEHLSVYELSAKVNRTGEVRTKLYWK